MSDLFKQLESATPGTETTDLEQVLPNLKLSSDGLIPAICQDHESRTILMMAWMNLDALRKTLTTGHVYFWSRSRGALWRKGETSGQTQSLVTMHLDCDGDTLLLTVEQTGVACHTGRKSCFYNRISDKGICVDQPIIKHPDTLYQQ